tara:strand:- start:254 stop:598 length:345 start_codon:yes stop_codon:yes gene_type:complete
MADVDWNMMNGLHKYVKKFKSNMLDINYESYKDFDYIQYVLMFLVDVVHKPKLMKFYKTKLLELGYEDKAINKLFYWIMRCDYKFETKQFSWYELQELDLPFDPEIRSTKWTII